MNNTMTYNENILQPLRPSLSPLSNADTQAVGNKNPITNDQLVRDVENLVSGFKHLLAEHPESPKEINIHFEITVLEKWLDGYHHGRAAALKIATNGAEWLEKHQEKFKMIADETVRLTAAGVGPLTLTQVMVTQDQRDSIAIVLTTELTMADSVHVEKMEPK